MFLLSTRYRYLQERKMYLSAKFGCFTSSGFGGVHNHRKKQPDRLKFGSGTKTTDKVYKVIVFWNRIRTFTTLIKASAFKRDNKWS